MTKRMALILLASLASAGTAVAADSGKESMATHRKMLDECVAKRAPSSDRQAAMQACKDMLAKRMPAGMPHEAPDKEMQSK